MGNQPRFRFDERVRIVSNEVGLRAIAGEAGFIAGIGDDEGEGFHYGVWIYRAREVWACWENDLESLGDFEEPNYLQTGESIRVSVDGELVDQDSA